MTRITLSARVGPDGVLRMAVPVGIDEADNEVQVTLEPVPPSKIIPQAEYSAWVKSMAGSWQGDFERPPQANLRNETYFEE